MSKYEFISDLAILLRKHDKTITFDDTATFLNMLDYTANDGNPYSGGRGVARVIDSAYKRCDEAGLTKTAECISLAYTNKDGEPAY